jgi:AraC family transcriptional regulator of arabinose operon
MDDPAVRRQVPAVEFPVPETGRVLVGELRQEADYRVRRSWGTTDWLLLHTAAGAGLVHSAGGTAHVTRPGEGVLIRPGTLQDYGTDPAAGSWHLLYAHVHPPAPWLALLDWPEAARDILSIRLGAAVDARVQQALRTAARSARLAVGRSELFTLNGIEEALLWYDTQNPRRCCACSSTSTPTWTRSSPRRGSPPSPTSPPPASRTCSPRRRARRCAVTSRRSGWRPPPGCWS